MNEDIYIYREREREIYREGVDGRKEEERERGSDGGRDRDKDRERDGKSV